MSITLGGLGRENMENFNILAKYIVRHFTEPRTTYLQRLHIVMPGLEYCLLIYNVAAFRRRGKMLQKSFPCYCHIIHLEVI